MSSGTDNNDRLILSGRQIILEKLADDLSASAKTSKEEREEDEEEAEDHGFFFVVFSAPRPRLIRRGR